MLSRIDGVVPWRDREEPAFFADAALAGLAGLAGLVRALHDACAGTGLAGGAETVCHRDLSPKNTVYRAGPVPVALLDWDLAGPGRRIDDVAFAGWHWGTLGGDADPAELGRRCRLLCDAYEGPAGGLLPRAELVTVMRDQIGATWRGIDAGADRDEPGMRRLRAAGAVETVRGWHDWLHRHRRVVESALHAA